MSHLRRYADNTEPVSIEVMANYGKTGIIIKNRIMKNREAEDGIFSVVLLF